MGNEIGAVLKKTPLFANLTDGELLALAARTSRKRYQQGEHLFSEGDPCTGFFLWRRARFAFSSCRQRVVNKFWLWKAGELFRRASGL